MICKNCGATLPDDAVFCPNCGQQFSGPTPQDPYQNNDPQQEPIYQPAQPTYQPPQQTYNTSADPLNATPIMIMGIISLALALFSETLIAGIAALVIAIIALKKYKEYESAGGPASGKAKLGKTFATVGLVISIILTALTVIAAIIIFFIVVLSIGGAAIASLGYNGRRIVTAVFESLSML